MNTFIFSYTAPCNFSAGAYIIDETGVLESTENMKRTEILKAHGDEIKEYGTEQKYYYFRIKDESLSNGCYRRRSNTRKGIEDKLCEYYLNKEKADKKAKTQDNKTLEQLFYEFMEHKREKVSAGTIRRMMID